MTNMPNAPLVYTLGVVRFPRVPNVERFADGFQDLIRSDYPVFDEVPIQINNVTLDPKGKVNVQHSQARMLQFAAHNREWAFLLTEELLGLHTIRYVDHGDFIERFKIGLRALLKVPGVGVDWIEAIGLRYVDIVTPRKGEQLAEYLHSWVIPPDAPDMTFREGMYVASYDTKIGILRFQSLRNPPTTLPPDLDTPIIQRNNWKRDRPLGEFVVMDMDHGCRFDPVVTMSVDMIGAKLSELRDFSKKLFLRAGTEHAMNIWKEKA